MDISQRSLFLIISWDILSDELEEKSALYFLGLNLDLISGSASCHHPFWVGVPKHGLDSVAWHFK